MSRILVVFCCVFAIVCSDVYGQDQIILQSAEELKGKVTEIKIDLIVYKDESNPNGPSIEIPKEDVFMIIYENGTTLKMSQLSGSSQVQSDTHFGKTKSKESKPTTDRFGRTKQDNLFLYEKRLKVGIPLTVIGIPAIAVGSTIIDEVVNRRSTNFSSGPYSGLTDAEALGIGIPLAAIGVAFTIIGPINIGAAINYRVRSNQLAKNTTISPHLPISYSYSGTDVDSGLGFGLKLKHRF